MSTAWHYLDHAASSPLRPEARVALDAALDAGFGNPSGAHALARAGRAALDDARAELAALVGAAPGDIVFTSGGTEADNLAVRGVLAARGGTAVCTAIEHKAVLEPVRQSGGRIVPVDDHGLVDLDALAASLDDTVTLVSVGLVNNEIGTVQRLDDVAAVVRARAPQAAIHTDAAQAMTWLDVGQAAASADLITLASHKCGGPVGVGVLVVRAGLTIGAQQVGGGQERERRSGTQDVASAVAFAAAARAAVSQRHALGARARAWRDELVTAIGAAVEDTRESAVPHGSSRDHLVAGVANVCLPQVDSEALLFLLEHDHRVLASAASSCASGAQEPSHVLAAIGIDRSRASGSLRLSLGWSTVQADIDAARDAVPAAVARLQAHSRDGAPA
ncbi:MAG: aminotransferase class V-fold PLP-dependent enzyme [Acidimicrobiales bacterium]